MDREDAVENSDDLHSPFGTEDAVENNDDFSHLRS